MTYQVNIIPVPNMATDRPKTCCNQFKDANRNANRSATTNILLYNYCPKCGMRLYLYD